MRTNATTSSTIPIKAGKPDWGGLVPRHLGVAIIRFERTQCDTAARIAASLRRRWPCRQARGDVHSQHGDRAHPGVDAYILAHPAWQQEDCGDLRDLVWEADPEIEETIRRSAQPYFVLNGNVCAFLAASEHLKLFLEDPTVPDPDGVINQRHGDATARAIQIYRGDSLNKNSLIHLLRATAANNRAGGWRRLAKTKR